MKPIDIVIVAAGGYGAGYVRELLDHPERADVRLAGIVEPYPESCPYIGEVREMGIPVFADLLSFYAQGSADLAVISSPIQFHAEQAVLAMDSGSHVLLEKPIAADSEHADKIRAARDRTGKLCAIGYQWCYNEALLALKRDILNGDLGAPLRLKAIALWPRAQSYYRRGIGWAGRRYDQQNRPVMDSVVSNATAHYLMNMLWMLGGAIDGAAEVANLRAVTARVNPIENFDSVFLRGEAAGAELLYIATHAVDRSHGPEFEYEFERGTIHYLSEDGDDRLIAKMTDGSARVYPGMSGAATVGPKLWRTIDAIKGDADPSAIPCPIEAACAHTRVMDALNALSPIDHNADDRRAHDADKDVYYLPGLFERLLQAYRAFEEPDEQIFT